MCLGSTEISTPATSHQHMPRLLVKFQAIMHEETRYSRQNGISSNRNKDIRCRWGWCGGLKRNCYQHGTHVMIGKAWNFQGLINASAPATIRGPGE